MKLISPKGKPFWFVHLSYGGAASVERLYHYLYDDAAVYLERKFRKWTDLRPV